MSTGESTLLPGVMGTHLNRYSISNGYTTHVIVKNTHLLHISTSQHLGCCCCCQHLGHAPPRPRVHMAVLCRSEFCAEVSLIVPHLMALVTQGPGSVLRLRLSPPPTLSHRVAGLAATRGQPTSQAVGVGGGYKAWCSDASARCVIGGGCGGLISI